MLTICHKRKLSNIVQNNRLMNLSVEAPHGVWKSECAGSGSRRIRALVSHRSDSDRCEINVRIRFWPKWAPTGDRRAPDKEKQQSIILTVRPPPGPKYYYTGLPGPPRLLHECIHASRRRCATDPAGALACRRGPKSPYSNIILSQDEIMPTHSGFIFACFLAAVGAVGPAGCP